MPVLESPLYAYLSDALAAASGRVYPKRAPEGTVLPYVTYERISAQRTYTFDPFEQTNAWVRARISFSCVAQTMLEAMQIGEDIVTALSGYEGDMEGLSVGSVDVVTEADLYDSQTRLYRRVVDVFVTYEEYATS